MYKSIISIIRKLIKNYIQTQAPINVSSNMCRMQFVTNVFLEMRPAHKSPYWL